MKRVQTRAHGLSTMLARETVNSVLSYVQHFDFDR